MKQLKTVAYTNTDTGETRAENSWVDMMFDDEEGYLFWAKKASVKSFIDMPLPDYFTWAEKGRLTQLQHYMLKGNQLLVYRAHNRIKPLYANNMSRILGMSEGQCRRLINKAKRYGILKNIEFKGELYYAYNPMYGFRGKRISTLVYVMFQDELIEHLKPWVINKFEQQAREIRPTITLF